MIDHTGVNVSDIAQSKAFYRAALAPLGYELVMEFEDVFKITIPDEDYEKIKMVGDAVKYIEEKQ